MVSFVIAKRCYDGESAFYVTAIKRGGLSIDNVRVWDTQRASHAWQARKWPSEAKAETARAKLESVGGFDDYLVTPWPFD